VAGLRWLASQRGGRAVAATPPTAPAHHLFRSLPSFFFTYNICRTGKKKEQKVTDVEESKNRKTDANTGQEEKI